MKYYIASGLENAGAVRSLKQILDGAGWFHTYDWTIHGSVQHEGHERIAEVAACEIEGIMMADVLIVLLPGGRGTHVELGAYIGQTHLGKLMQQVGLVEVNGRRAVIYSDDPAKDFGSEGGQTCAFYHHPLVERFDSMDAMIKSLIGAG